jgi:hypothetical protein
MDTKLSQAHTVPVFRVEVLNVRHCLGERGRLYGRLLLIPNWRGEEEMELSLGQLE